MTLPLNSAAPRLACALLWALATSLPAQAVTPRYQPNAAGDEITDTATGLIWRRCDEGHSWTGSACTGAGAFFSWDRALAQAKSQASISGLPWRLPNIKELTSLVTYSRIAPAIDTTAFPGASGAPTWSSTPYAGDSSSAWIVIFSDGYVWGDLRDYGYGAARLVRDGQ